MIQLHQYAHMPASLVAQKVNNLLAENHDLVVTAPPGAGKSTLLPLTILEKMGEGKILMLEPRRLAARQIAERMAHMLGEKVGMTVGYRVRFEQSVSSDTRIEVLTEGILTRMLVDDPTLEGVSVVIFDEFHERSIHSDLALALCRQVQQFLRPDMRIVIMSATIKATAICRHLDAQLVECQGRMFPVDVKYLTHDFEPSDFIAETVRFVRMAHAEHEGDILVFLPGQAEIERCKALLDDALPGTNVYPLYGNLLPEQQRIAIAPSKHGERKIVLATSIAETSLTIESVRIVIDTGLCRRMTFDVRTGLSHLETVRISLDMAKQRAGRAGRVSEGVCYRLWSKAAEKYMLEQRNPEIADADIAQLVLDVAAFGESDIFSLPWLTPPPSPAVAKACRLLQNLGALEKICPDSVVRENTTQGELTRISARITKLGQRLSSLPCHPRIARMILQADDDSSKALAADIAALLEEKDPVTDMLIGCDLPQRILLKREACRRHQMGRWCRIAEIADAYCRMVHVSASVDTLISAEEVGALVAYAYPERVAQRQDKAGTYRLASGDTIHIDISDPMSSYPYLAIASLHVGSRVFLAAPFELPDVETLISERDNVSWDCKQGQLLMQRERRIGKLLIESKPLHAADRQLLVDTLCQAARKEGLSMFTWDDRVSAIQRRVAQVATWHPELNLPDLSTDHLLLTASEWLPFYVENNGRIRTTVDELKRIDICDVIWSLIPYDLQSIIDRLAPSHIKVPTGSCIRIDYRHGAEAPILSVRLQECFGMANTPRVDDGRQPVLMELLSPGFKPVQLTQDLSSFWQNTYFEVRKELRRRYPKHYWPDNPLEAEAVRGVKRS